MHTLFAFILEPKKIVLFIFFPWKQTKCSLAIMIRWVPYMVFIIWNVISYWNVCWCIFKIQFEHFMHGASSITHNHFTSYSSHLQLKQKNWNTYVMSKFNANINYIKFNLTWIKYVNIEITNDNKIKVFKVPSGNTPQTILSLTHANLKK
jgi:hypothetical protein